jgi:hypothetical protein
MTATATAGQSLLIRRLISRPDQLTFYLCWAPPGRPATMTCFITIAGRRWPAEETFKTGKDVLGWDQTQARTWDGICRHTALVALAQLRAAAIRGALTARIALPAASGGTGHDGGATGGDDQISDADLQIPLGDAPVPATSEFVLAVYGSLGAGVALSRMSDQTTARWAGFFGSAAMLPAAQVRKTLSW